MTSSSTGSTTRVDEIAEGIYRISSPVDVVPGGFTFNQFLVLDDEPLLFHTGLRRSFPLVREAIERVMPVDRLRYIAFSHYEADECGALNEFLAVAPRAVAVCSQVAAMVSVADFADRPPRPMADGETLTLGRHVVEWYDVPHLPHGWECGLLGERTTKTLFCGDLFTQAGAQVEALTERDILGPSEAMRSKLDYFSHTKHASALVERLARTRPGTLACMHGSSWRGDGENLLLELGRTLQG